jgi:hypothetical protein
MIQLGLVEAELFLHNTSCTDICAVAKGLDSVLLIQLLNSRWVRVGDAAYEAITEPQDLDRVAQAYLKGKYTRHLGRVRALNRLISLCCKNDLAKQCYRKALDDPKLVVDGIYGVVYSIDIEALPKIREMLANDPPESLKKYLVMAEAALAEKNPRLFKTGHRVDGARWGW